MLLLVFHIRLTDLVNMKTQDHFNHTFPNYWDGFVGMNAQSLSIMRKIRETVHILANIMYPLLP